MGNLSVFIQWKPPIRLACLLVICLACLPAFSQIQSVATVRNLGFGAFAREDKGGTVIISNTGTRDATGSIILLNLGIPYYQAIFEVEAPAGTIISLLNGPDAVLTGSNGGSMLLKLGSSDPLSPFISTANSLFRTQVSIGGTLTVGSEAESPAGSYTGSFYITFNNE